MRWPEEDSGEEFISDDGSGMYFSSTFNNLQRGGITDTRSEFAAEWKPVENGGVGPSECELKYRVLNSVMFMCI